MTAWIVTCDHGDSATYYGPFDDEQRAQRFAAFVTAEVDPATARRLRDPVDEMVGAWKYCSTAYGSTP